MVLTGALPPAHSPLRSGSPGAGFPKCSTLCPLPIHQSLRENTTAQLSKVLLSWERGALRGSTGPGDRERWERPYCCFVPCHSNVSFLKRGARTLSSPALTLMVGFRSNAGSLVCGPNVNLLPSDLLIGKEDALSRLTKFHSAFAEADGAGWLPLHKAAVQLNKNILQITLKGKLPL